MSRPHRNRTKPIIYPASDENLHPREPLGLVENGLKIHNKKKRKLKEPRPSSVRPGSLLKQQNNRITRSNSRTVPYSIVRKLGEGGCGEVQEVIDGDSHFWAAKFIKEDLPSWQKEVQMFRRFEGQPFVPQLKESNYDDGLGVLIMERIDHRLDEYLTEPRPEDEVVSIAGELMDAVDSIASAQACHGDLALFNVGLVNKRVVLFDFDDSSTDTSGLVVDATRLFIETFRQTRSDGTAPIDGRNAALLRRELKPWLINILEEEGLLPSDGLTMHQAEKIWFKAYKSYCKKVGLPTLEE